MKRALIVGAGIGGLAAGIALRRISWDVEIFEQADAPRELGFGVAWRRMPSQPFASWA